jgi:hypothetical protein
VTVTRRQLGSFERAAVETSRHAAFNAVAVLRLSRTPDLDGLRAGLDEAQRCEPLLRARVVRTPRGLAFETAAMPAIGLAHFPREDDSSWRTCTERELARGFDLDSGPLARATLVASASRGPCELVITIHHAIVDATGFVVLCDLLLSHGFDGARAPSRGPDGADPRSDSLSPCPDDLFPPAFRSFSGRRRLASYLIRQMIDEVRWRLAVRGKRRPRTPETATCRVFPLALSEDLTSDLVRRARSERVALVAALNAALLLSAREILYRDEDRPLRYFSFPDLRGSLNPRPEPGALGGYLTVMRFTAGMRRTGFWELARDLHRQLNTSFRQGDKFASALAAPMAMRSHRRSGARMGSVAASFSGPADGARGVAHPELERLHAFVTNLAIGPEVTAQVRIFGGRLLWDFVYLEEDLDPETMAAVAAGIEDRSATAVRG